MSEIVSSINIRALLTKLVSGEWLVPEFQREFVWDISNISALVSSIIESKPIGMATIWEQEEDYNLDLSPLWLYDWDKEAQKTDRTYFRDPEKKQRKVFAILDGRQRSTAIAIAFGGFKPESGIYKYAGRFFIDVKAKDDHERVVFIKDSDLKKRDIWTDKAAILKGLYPLVSFIEGKDLFSQWIDYMQAVKDPEYYENGKLPSEEDLARSDKILRDALAGIRGTELAVYKVPAKHDLGTICDIFETLNTTGTVVSKVDLIHSWLYAETVKLGFEEPLQLRDWMASLGEIEGAIGWSVPEKRPELVAQMSTACHVGLEKKYEPRPLKASKVVSITSVKSPDLLATPTKHWIDVVNNDERLATYIGDFQDVVGGGRFPFSQCPYPISACIYVSLRWHKEFDEEVFHSSWDISHLNSLYKSFFWRNSLSGRYDQGFLTQLGTDILKLKEFLLSVPGYKSVHHWAKDTNNKLEIYMDKEVPSKTSLVGRLTNGRPGGAFQSAVVLSMQPQMKKDLISRLSMYYPSEHKVELHHIYPKAWCKNNITPQMSKELDPDNLGVDWVNSLANLMPLMADSNKNWKDKSPAVYFEENSIDYHAIEDSATPAMIDKKAFELLCDSSSNPKEFWEHRASLMADNLLSLVPIKL